MIRTVLPATVVALALVAPSVGHAQMTQPMPSAQPDAAMTNASVTPGEQPQMGGGMDQGYAAPAPGYYMQPVSPRTTWIPGHYNWDPNTSNYVWTAGHYVEAPTATAQWIPGHWAQTPTSWIWIEGTWQ